MIGPEKPFSRQREKVASVSEPDEGPAHMRRNKAPFDLAIGAALTLPLSRVPPSPAMRERGFRNIYFVSNP
jgi:hypothetical protein